MSLGVKGVRRSVCWTGRGDGRLSNRWSCGGRLSFDANSECTNDAIGCMCLQTAACVRVYTQMRVCVHFEDHLPLLFLIFKTSKPNSANWLIYQTETGGEHLKEKNNF